MYDDNEPKVNEEFLKNMLELGLNEESCRLALLITDNNVDTAVGLAMEYDVDRLIEMYENMDQEEAEGEPIDANEVNSIMQMFSQSLQSKMVIIVRNDLGMSVGKIAAQVGHAVLGVYKVAQMENPQAVDQWEMLAWPKIVLQVESEAKMDELRQQAENAGLWNFQVQDAGRTEVEPGTKTVLAIGPDLNSKIDVITGKLKLLK